MFRRDADVKQSPSNLTEMTQGITVALRNSYIGQHPLPVLDMTSLVAFVDGW